MHESPLKLASQVSPLARIVVVEMLEGDFKRQKATDDHVAGDTAVEVQHTYSLSDDRRLAVHVSFRLSAPAPKAVTKADFVSVSAKYELVYGLEGERLPGNDSIEAFARINSTYNAWPYWREYVQSMVVRMGLPALVMPNISATEAVRLAGY